MPWFRVDDNFAFHPKALVAGNQALGLWARAGSWSSQQLTDGFIPKDVLTHLGGRPSDARALVAAGLWSQVAAGWQFHQWDKYQMTRAEVEDRRKKRAEAGRVGGLRSGQVRSKTEASASSIVEPPALPVPTREHLSVVADVEKPVLGDAR